jgi:methyl-accepting chemotaxis protein
MFIVVLASLSGVVGGYSVWSLGQQFRALKDLTTYALGASEMNADVAKSLLNAREYLNTRQNTNLQEARHYLAAISTDIEQALREVNDPERRATLEKMKPAFAQLKTDFERLVAVQAECDRVLRDILEDAGPQMADLMSQIIDVSARAKDFETAVIVGRALEALFRTRIELRSFVATTTHRNPDHVLEAYGELDTRLSAASVRLANVNSPVAAYFSEVEKQFGRYTSGFGDLQLGLQNLDALRDEALDKSGEAISKWADQVKAAAKADEAALAQSAMLSLKRNEASIAIAIALAFLVAGLTSVLGARAMSNAITSISTTMAKLASGDTNLAADFSDRRDEIGEMGKAVVVFRDAALEKARLEREALAAREAAARETELVREREAEQERAAARAREQQQREADAARDKAIAEERAIVVRSIGEGMARVAAKDLSYRLNTPLPEAYRKLQSDFNHAMEQLEAALETVRTNTDLIAVGADEITNASGDLSRRAEQQAASLEQTSASLGEVTGTVKQTAEGATQARAIVATAKADAEQGGDVVRQAIEAMGKIEASSQHIGRIIGVIDEIAFQTNLLALNAGVEAARAGEAGRGFAVVASEVRALAQRSAESAKEIKALISGSTHEVEEGVRLVGETGAALQSIVAKVGEINKAVCTIATNALEQANSLQQISQAVAKMDESTQENAAMAEKATAASRTLAAQSEKLAGLVGEFKIGRNSNSSSDPLRSELQRVAPHVFAPPVRSNAGAKAPRAAKPAIASPVVASHASAARADDWSEF